MLSEVSSKTAVFWSEVDSILNHATDEEMEKRANNSDSSKGVVGQKGTTASGDTSAGQGNPGRADGRADKLVCAQASAGGKLETHSPSSR